MKRRRSHEEINSPAIGGGAIGKAIETEHEYINLQMLTEDLTMETLVSISDRRSRRTAN